MKRAEPTGRNEERLADTEEAHGSALIDLADMRDRAEGAEGEVREAERTAELWEGLWEVAIERAEEAERKLAAVGALADEWSARSIPGEWSRALHPRQAADSLRAILNA